MPTPAPAPTPRRYTPTPTPAPAPAPAPTPTQVHAHARARPQPVPCQRQHPHPTHQRYTVSVLLGLGLVLPAALGWCALPLVVAAALVFNLSFLLASDAEANATTDVFSAGGFANKALLKAHFVTPEGLVVAPALRGGAEATLTREQRARLVFDRLDSDQSGAISSAELGDLLVSWGLPRTDAAACLREVDRGAAADGKIDFREFYEGLAPVWEFACAIVASNSGAEERALQAAKDFAKRVGRPLV